MKPHTVTPCKGFWNMCACEKCRKQDRELESAMERDPNLQHSLGDLVAKSMNAGKIKE